MGTRNAPGEHYPSFTAFYPDYLAQHSQIACRRLHFVGTLAALLLLASLLIWPDWRLALLVPVAGYGPAWVGHYVFEKNRPATFSHPFYSLLGDLVMFRDMLTGRVAGLRG